MILEDKRVLIAEDLKEMRFFMKELLVYSFGCKVDIAPDGEEALKLIKDKSYDLLITDFDMPKMNGVELVNAVRRDLKNGVPVIIVTGNLFGPIKKALGDFKSIFLEAKPFHSAELLQKIECILQK